MLRRTFLVLTATLAILPPVSGYALKDDITISVESRNVRDLSSEGLLLDFYVKLNNSSSKTYHLTAYSYRCVIDDQEFFRLPPRSLEEGEKIAPRSHILIRLPIKITYKLLFDSVAGIEDKEVVPCFLMGEMAFAEGRRNRDSLPFAFKGEFPLFKEPALEITAVNAKILTIGGADLTFEARLRNPNGFEVEVTRLPYDLKFGGHPVKNGLIPGAKAVAGHSDALISLPLLLNFFEVGRDVYALLQQPQLNCRFSGEMEIRTRWGSLILPFDVERRIPVTKSGQSPH